MGKERAAAGGRAVATCSVVVLVGLFAEPARVAHAGGARADAPDPWARPFAASLHMGLRTPLGSGLAYEVAPVRLLVLEAGVGVGLDGPQVAISTRARVPFRSWALSLGIGASRGAFSTGSTGCVPIGGGCASGGLVKEYAWDAAVWRNFEASIERRSEDGFQWRVYGGTAKILNWEDGVCIAPTGTRCAAQEYSTAFIGVSIGQSW